MSPSTPHDRPTILLVDDEPANIAVLSDLLRGKYRVRAVASGAAALDQVVTHRREPDLVVLDLMMPEMDGFEVLRRLKADAQAREIPVIVLTADDRAEAEQRALELGAVDFVTKPIRPAAIHGRIAVRLELAAARRRLQEHNEWLEAEVVRRTEEALREREAQERTYGALFEAMQIGFATFARREDEHGCLVAMVFERVNDAFCCVTGVDRDEMTGRSVCEAFPLFEGRLARYFADALAAGTPMSHDVDFVRTGRIAELTMFTLPDGRGAWAAVDVTDRRVALASIERARDQNAALLRELNHRVKNNLNVLASLTRLQASAHADATDLGTEFERLRDRIHTMGLVHNDLYTSENPGLIDMAIYARSLATRILIDEARGARFDLDLDLDPVDVGIDVAVPLGLILNELLTNARVHTVAADSEGRVHVALQIAREPGALVCSVADNGGGIDDPERARRGFGMTIVRVLSEQLGARWELSGEGGTDHRVTIPLG